MGQQRGQRCGTGAFGHHLLHLEVEGDRRLDVVVVDHHDVDPLLLGEPHRRCTGAGDGDALGDRVAAQHTAVAAVHLRSKRGVGGHLHPHHLDARVDPSGRGDGTGEQTTAADGYHHRVEVGCLVQQFEHRGALAGHHHRAVVGRHEHQVAFIGQTPGVLGGFGECGPSSDHLGPQGAGVGHLHQRCALGHHQRRGDVEARGVMGEALGMVARRHRHHAAGSFLGRQGEQSVQCAAFFERPGELEVLELHHDLGPGDGRQRVRQGRRRGGHRTADAVGSGQDVGKGDGGPDAHQVADITADHLMELGGLGFWIRIRGSARRSSRGRRRWWPSRRLR